MSNQIIETPISSETHESQLTSAQLEKGIQAAVTAIANQLEASDQVGTLKEQEDKIDYLASSEFIKGIGGTEALSALENYTSEGRKVNKNLRGEA